MYFWLFLLLKHSITSKGISSTRSLLNYHKALEILKQFHHWTQMGKDWIPEVEHLVCTIGFEFIFRPAMSVFREVKILFVTLIAALWERMVRRWQHLIWSRYIFFPKQFHYETFLKVIALLIETKSIAM